MSKKKLTREEELMTWKQKWESDNGKYVLSKIEQLKQGYIEYAMASLPNSASESMQQCTAINRAQGVNEVLNLINTGLFEANKPKKEDVDKQ